MMRKLTLFTLLFFQIVTLSAEIELSSQEDVNNFSGGPNLNQGLRINGTVTDLTPLSHLLTINGNLIIEMTSSLSDLNGLENLTSITGIIKINDNEKLATVNALNHDNLVVGKSIEINDNPILVSINMEHISAIPTFNRFKIYANPLLLVLKAPQHIVNIVSALSVYENEALETFTGFDSLESADILEIANTKCIIFPSFPMLTSVQNYIEVVNNTNVLELHFPNLGGQINIFEISNNASLNLLEAPKNIEHYTTKMSIYENPALTVLTGLDQIKFAKYFEIHDTKVCEFPTIDLLDTIETKFSLINNTCIEDLYWLKNSPLTIEENLIIKNNDELSICNIESVCAHLLGNKPNDIDSNKTCCFDGIILKNQCEGVGDGHPEICDQIDNNCNGVIDEDADCCDPNISLNFCQSNTTLEACNGIIMLTPNNPYPPFSFLWNDGNTSNIRSNLCPGTYSVTIEDNASNTRVFNFLMN